MEGVHQPSARGHNWVPGFTPSSAWQMAPSAAKHASLGKEEQWCFRGMISWNIMEYHGISYRHVHPCSTYFNHLQHRAVSFFWCRRKPWGNPMGYATWFPLEAAHRDHRFCGNPIKRYPLVMTNIAIENGHL